MDRSRRDFLIKGAIVGGAAWTAPSIVTVSSAMAANSPAVCRCTRSAFGLQTAGLIAVGPDGVAGTSQECVARTTPITVAAGLATLTAEALCGHFGAGCEAMACVLNVDLTVGGSTLNINSFQTCVSSATTSTAGTCTQCADATGVLTFNGNAIPLPTGCNALVALPSPLNALLSILFNVQSCSSGVLTVKGLVISILGTNEVITISESSAGCAGCTNCPAAGTCASCTTCALCNATPTA